MKVTETAVVAAAQVEAYGDTIDIVIQSITNQIGAWNLKMILMFTDTFDYLLM